MTSTLAYGVDSPEGHFHSMNITRRKIGVHDVAVDILYSGICHSDIHAARNEWGGSQYPLVPGHEILGRVASVGTKVSKFKVGDLVGVGTFTDSCRDCQFCNQDIEQFCEQGATFTYNGLERDKKTPTYGGYSTNIVVDEHFVLNVPEKFSKLEGIAPLLCAGITTWSPLNAHKSKVAPGKKVGIVGLGGLGHMGVKFAVSMGAEVTVFSTSPNKEQDAKRLGAKNFVLSKNPDAMKAVAGTFDLILDTVSAKHDLTPFVNAIKTLGVLAVVGAPPEPFEVNAFSLLFGNKTIYGSGVGGIKETQEMIDYCAKHDIVADVEVISIDRVAEAFERTLKSDIKYRFVIDIKSLKQ